MKILRFFLRDSPKADQASANPSARGMPREELIHACRSMEAKELALAKAAETRGDRVDHVYNAASWSERADVLQRIETSFGKRDALDRAENKRTDAAELDEKTRRTAALMGDQQ